jgi:hypothetical protein
MVQSTQFLRVNDNGQFTELFSSYLGPHLDSLLERSLAKCYPERPELTEISNLTVLAKILSSSELKEGCQFVSRSTRDVCRQKVRT